MSKKGKGLRNKDSASSSNASFLLERTGVSAQAGFALFGEFTAAAYDLDHNVNVLLKKLSKKSEITRAKALEELLEALAAMDSEEVGKLALRWASDTFARVRADPVPRVRILGMQIHGRLCQRLGRAVQAHVPALSGAWVAAQFDTSKEVAAETRAGLAALFTPVQFERLVRHCQPDILARASDIILSEDPTQFCDPKVFDEHEIRSVFERLQVESLLGLCSLVDLLQGDLRADLLAPLVQSRVFWKLSRHENVTIQLAAYQFVGRLLGCGSLAEAVLFGPGPVASYLLRTALVFPQVTHWNVHAPLLEAIWQLAGQLVGAPAADPPGPGAAAVAGVDLRKAFFPSVTNYVSRRLLPAVAVLRAILAACPKEQLSGHFPPNLATALADAYSLPGATDESLARDAAMPRFFIQQQAPLARALLLASVCWMHGHLPQEQSAPIVATVLRRCLLPGRPAATEDGPQLAMDLVLGLFEQTPSGAQADQLTVLLRDALSACLLSDACPEKRAAFLGLMAGATARSPHCEPLAHALTRALLEDHLAHACGAAASSAAAVTRVEDAVRIVAQIPAAGVAAIVDARLADELLGCLERHGDALLWSPEPAVSPVWLQMLDLLGEAAAGPRADRLLDLLEAALDTGAPAGAGFLHVCQVLERLPAADPATGRPARVESLVAACLERALFFTPEEGPWADGPLRSLAFGLARCLGPADAPAGDGLLAVLQADDPEPPALEAFMRLLTLSLDDGPSCRGLGIFLRLAQPGADEHLARLLLAPVADACWFDSLDMLGRLSEALARGEGPASGPAGDALRAFALRTLPRFEATLSTTAHRGGAPARRHMDLALRTGAALVRLLPAEQAPAGWAAFTHRPAFDQALGQLVARVPAPDLALQLGGHAAEVYHLLFNYHRAPGLFPGTRCPWSDGMADRAPAPAPGPASPDHDHDHDHAPPVEDPLAAVVTLASFYGGLLESLHQAEVRSAAVAGPAAMSPAEQAHLVWGLFAGHTLATVLAPVGGPVDRELDGPLGFVRASTPESVLRRCLAGLPVPGPGDMPALVRHLATLAEAARALAGPVADPAPEAGWLAALLHWAMAGLRAVATPAASSAVHLLQSLLFEAALAAVLEAAAEADHPGAGSTSTEQPPPEQQATVPVVAGLLASLTGLAGDQSFGGTGLRLLAARCLGAARHRLATGHHARLRSLLEQVADEAALQTETLFSFSADSLTAPFSLIMLSALCEQLTQAPESNDLLFYVLRMLAHALRAHTLPARSDYDLLCAVTVLGLRVVRRFAELSLMQRAGTGTGGLNLLALRLSFETTARLFSEENVDLLIGASAWARDSCLRECIGLWAECSGQLDEFAPDLPYPEEADIEHLPGLALEQAHQPEYAAPDSVAFWRVASNDAAHPMLLKLLLSAVASSAAGHAKRTDLPVFVSRFTKLLPTAYLLDSFSDIESGDTSHGISPTEELLSVVRLIVDRTAPIIVRHSSYLLFRRYLLLISENADLFQGSNAVGSADGDSQDLAEDNCQPDSFDAFVRRIFSTLLGGWLVAAAPPGQQASLLALAEMGSLSTDDTSDMLLSTAPTTTTGGPRAPGPASDGEYDSDSEDEDQDADGLLGAAAHAATTLRPEAPLFDMMLDATSPFPRLKPSATLSTLLAAMALADCLEASPSRSSRRDLRARIRKSALSGHLLDIVMATHVALDRQGARRLGAPFNVSQAYCLGLKARMAEQHYSPSEYLQAARVTDLELLSSPDLLLLLSSVAYFRCLQAFPSALRFSYFDLGVSHPTRAQFLKKITSDMYSPRIVSHEVDVVRQINAEARARAEERARRHAEAMAARPVNPALPAYLQQQQALPLADEEPFRLSASSGQRTIAASYHFEDAQLSVTVRMPDCYPLLEAAVEPGEGKGVSSAQWHRWMASVRSFLAAQNGTIADALQQWSTDVKRRFDGVSECTVCQCVVQPVDGSLPRITCHQCRNKFHSACLFKWFKSSSQSTCPLCRHSF
ncbi:hypothetical protein H696_05901 [Fonticula alba]|uniref:E3 ubiquitin-protein ligase listerin n=1 Tax=Fonticula alba TaxID=691883 RepID=A0A058Z026_FONAL|nr:hypothetical protein H696_05901 [Fonticula alba]KCV67614.1 hypothetical protein H696_05901 [Fonticula alba]|eukprot:XP_009497952.1 hypothetical protein H696_05901 [Fonticula alba]